MRAVAREDVGGCLYNWLGCGNMNGRFWFVGLEESLALSRCERISTVSDYFEIRRDFEIAMDLEEVYERRLGRPLSSFRRDTAWHKIARFLLSWDGETTSLDKCDRLVTGPNSRVGRTGSDSFVAETFPLPRGSNDTIGRYGGIWDSVEAYEEEVLPKRMEMFEKGLISSETVDIVYVYGLSNPCSHALRNRFKNTRVGTWPSGVDRVRNIEVYELEVTENRTITLVHGPFFKRGTSNEALETLASDLAERRE